MMGQNIETLTGCAGPNWRLVFQWFERKEIREMRREKIKSVLEI